MRAFQKYDGNQTSLRAILNCKEQNPDNRPRPLNPLQKRTQYVLKWLDHRFQKKYWNKTSHLKDLLLFQREIKELVNKIKKEDQRKPEAQQIFQSVKKRVDWIDE